MKIHSHNKEAYKRVKNAFKTSKRTCVVQPTGTGKSYIALQLVKDCKIDTKILYVTSYDSVRCKFINLLKDYVPDKLISCQTYMGLLRKDLKGYDVIILDEFHRVGAEKWGESVESILKACPNAYILGLSATPVRYMDNKRDMSKELFNGNIASEMSLAQAIARGILPLPKYVTCFYSMKDEYATAFKRVSKIKLEKHREEALRLLERAKGYLEKSNGLSDVFEDYIEATSGRYIVFCKNKVHMKEMIEESKNWFKNVNPNVNYYSIDSSMSYSSAREVERKFESDNSDALKLLFCIDKYNEGYHLDSLNGVILLRPTSSPNVYLQQIGRALASGGNSPLIIDVVRNMRCLSHCETLKQEVNTLFRESSEFDKSFNIFAYMQDFEMLLREAQDLCNVLSFDEKFDLLLEYKNEFGHVDISSNLEYKGYPLGAFIKSWRRAYIAGKLSSYEIERLNSIGFIWAVNLNFNDYLGLLEEYKSEFGNLDIPARCKYKGYPLGSYVQYLRNCYRNNKLSDECIKILNSIGFNLSGDKRCLSLDEYVSLLIEYKNEFGVINVNTHEGLMYKGVNLRNGLVKLRRSYVNGTLSDYYVGIAAELGINLNPVVPLDKKMQLFEEYKREFGTLINITHKTKYKGYPLGDWLHYYKTMYAKGELDKRVEKTLESIGYVWKKPVNMTERNFNLLLAYKKEFGNLDITVSQVYKGESIGKIVANIRARYRENRLSKDQIEKLESIGFIWEASRKNKTLSKYLEILTEYKQEFGTLSGISTVMPRYKGVRLYDVIMSIRRKYAANELSAEFKKCFDDLGFEWESVNSSKEPVSITSFDEWFYLFCCYKQEFGNLDIKYNCIYKGKNLGNAVKRFRNKYASGTLTSDEFSRLNSIGFIWKKRNKK